MTKYNVKKIENTNTMSTTLTTSCKKRDTAINRFCRFLSEYDSCFKDSLLIATTHICYAGDCNDIVYKAVSESDEYILTYTEYTPTDDDKNNVVFTVIIEFKHDENTTHYKSLANMSTSNNAHNAPKTIWSICNQDGNIKDFTDRKELFEYAYKNNLYGNFETIWIEEKELKDERFDYYETVDYEELDLYKIRTMLELDICDMKVNNTKDTESDTNDTNKDTNDTNKDTNDNENKDNVTISLGSLDDVKIDLSQESNNKTQQTCHIKAYYDGKELTIPYNDYKCRKYAVEYIHNLFKERVVPYETIFTLHYNTTAETITILTVIPTTDLMQYNIEAINDGLKYDSYKEVREGFRRLCNIITDKMKVCFDLHSGDNVYYYTIMKSRFEGLYTFKSDTMCRTQSPESFTRWLYYHTFTHSIELKCWYRDLRGETK